MKILLSSIVIALSTQIVSAADTRPAEQLFTKKCAMCHNINRPQNKMEKRRMVAPPLTAAMAGVVITIDAIEGPFSDKELRDESIEFIKDYLYNPTRDKTNCEDHVVNRFGMMPSLKGFISPKELDVLVPWVYDNFKPTKVNGKY